MESSIQEALRARDSAEKLFSVKDFSGAKSYALQAQMLCPQLEGISQMVATFEIYDAAQRHFAGEIDFYLILGLEPCADKWTLKRQYKKLAVLLHPDKNKTVGADGAFKLVYEAFTLLSDNAKRKSYDQRRKKQLSCGVLQTNLSSVQGVGSTGFENCSKSLSSHRLDTFWTVCTSCMVQYEYLRKYVNKRLSCKNCRSIFVAVETGFSPVSPPNPWPYSHDNGYGSHGCNGVTYIPTTSPCFAGNGVSGHRSGHYSDRVSNASFHCSPVPSFAGVVDHNGLPTNSISVVHQANGNVSREKDHEKHYPKNAVFYMSFDGQNGDSEATVTKLSRPAKKMKIDVRTATRNDNEEMVLKSDSEVKSSNGNGNIKYNSRISTAAETATKLYSVAPAFDARKLLIDKARSVIRSKLEEMKLASAAAPVADKNERALAEVNDEPLDQQLKLKKAVSVPITVPDSDFHDFDKDRSEECFQPKQIWALYDEEDGMPRLYCLIRQVISLKPFKVHISYLSSKTDTEFGLVNWLDSGFTKSCGHFRAYNTDIIDQVNIFSHLLSREKAGRGGCVRIYPRSGDIWAVYRNWSSDWDRSTPDEVRHQYEMVEVLDDYSEELGLCVSSLIKVHGYKTVYQRNTDSNAIRWIPRREMLRFSHQVPSCVLQEKVTGLPDGCFDLDPAATPEELLQAATAAQAEMAHKIESCVSTAGEPFQPSTEIKVEEKQPFESPIPSLQNINKAQIEKTPSKDLEDFSEHQDSDEVMAEKNPSEVARDFNEVQAKKRPVEVLQDLTKVKVERTPEVPQDYNGVLFKETPNKVADDLNKVAQDFKALQAEKTPFEVLQDFNDVWVDKSTFEVLQDSNGNFAEKRHYTITDAATSEEFLNRVKEVQPQKNHSYQGQNCNATPSEVLPGINKAQEGKLYQMESCAASPQKRQSVTDLQFESKQMFRAHNLEFCRDMPEVRAENAPHRIDKQGEL